MPPGEHRAEQTVLSRDRPLLPGRHPAHPARLPPCSKTAIKVGKKEATKEVKREQEIQMGMGRSCVSRAELGTTPGLTKVLENV